MDKQQLFALAEKSEYGYGLALQLARERIARIDDLRQQCLRSGAKYIDSPKAVIIDYLNRPYQVTFPEIEVSLAGEREAIPIRDKILILHYFGQAKGTPPSNRKITYKELADGIHYFPVFYKRAIAPIVSHFGKEPSLLLDTARILGGNKTGYGDMAVTLNAFSKVPITLILWQGDKEFSPEGNMIFDSSISDYLTNEDINVLCETIAWRLVRLLKAGGDKSGKSRD